MAVKKVHRLSGKITVQLTADCPAWAEDEENYREYMRAWCENDPMDFFQQFASIEPKITDIDDVRKVD